MTPLYEARVLARVNSRKITKIEVETPSIVAASKIVKKELRDKIGILQPYKIREASR